MRAGTIGGTWIVRPYNGPAARSSQRPKPVESERDEPENEKPSDASDNGKLVDRSV